MVKKSQLLLVWRQKSVLVSTFELGTGKIEIAAVKEMSFNVAIRDLPKRLQLLSH